VRSKDTLGRALGRALAQEGIKHQDSTRDEAYWGGATYPDDVSFRHCYKVRFKKKRKKKENVIRMRDAYAQAVLPLHDHQAVNPQRA
jgi:hypothetical protein